MRDIASSTQYIDLPFTSLLAAAYKVIYAGRIRSISPMEIHPHPSQRGQTLQFLDSFIVEGYKAFLRFGMAILIQQRGAILKLQSIWELTQLITPSLFVDAAIVRSTKYATIADEMCATAAGVFINYANVKRRALPKFIGDGVAAIMDQQRGSDIEPMEDEDDTDAELSPPKQDGQSRVWLRWSRSKATPGDPALLQVEDANQQQQQQQLLQPQPQPRIQVDFFVADSDEATSIQPQIALLVLNEDMSGDSYFVNASLTSLTIGGGGEHVAIHLDAELRYGSTGKCTTFMNDAFTMDKRTRFECLVVEAFAFSSA
ncbi:hypothetical protein BSLG_003441 [Batrachochytrium salamandrivorans]|nr:hypothetical protein BSLG_003441 [Batrachochytrium salamandrivorans]